MVKQQWSLEIIKEKLRAIKDMGYIPATRHHDTGIGQTLEELLELQENNIALPDFGNLELKTHRTRSSSFITILTKSPEGIKNRNLLEKFGYPRERDGKFILHQTIYLNKPNERGFVLGYDPKSKNLNIYKDDELLGYYTIAQLEAKFEEKIGDGVILVFAKVRKTEIGAEEFRYNEALLLKNFDLNKYLEYIKYDIRIGRYPDGRIHDHGSGFRVKKADLKNIFQISEKIL